MNALKIGWASRDVGTDKPVYIPGQFHVRLSQGVFDPVTVNVLVIDNGTDCVIFVSADVVVIRNYLLDDIRARVAERNPAIPVDKLLMNATHTHTGPSVYGDTQNGADEGAMLHGFDNLPMDGLEAASNDEYREFFCRQTVDAIDEAYTRREPGGLAYGYGFAVVGHSRRTVYFDDLSQRAGATSNSRHGVNGHASMYGNTNDDQFSHYEAGADHFINLLYTFDARNRLTGALINVPCPSQNSEGEWRLSASFWNEVRQAIRADVGDIHLLAQSAAGGDLAPRILHYKNAQARRFKLKYGSEPEPIAEWNARRDIGERIATAFTEVLSWAKKDIQTELPIRHLVDTVHLEKRRITPQEAAADQELLDQLMRQDFKQDGSPRERLMHDSILIAGRKRCRTILERYKNQDREPALPMELHVLRIGDIAFASNRFELYMDYMHRIQARSPFVQTFIVQLAGVPGADGGTYLATERGAWGQGYSASRYCNLVSPRGGQQLVDESVRRLKTLLGEGKE